MTSFLRSLRSRGLSGVRLVISDSHEGLKGAIAAVMLGVAWQRRRVHYAEHRIMPSRVRHPLLHKGHGLLKSA